MRFSSVAFGLPYLLVELFYLGACVADGRADGRADARSRDYQISRMHKLPNFLTHGAPLELRL